MEPEEVGGKFKDYITKLLSSWITIFGVYISLVLLIYEVIWRLIEPASPAETITLFGREYSRWGIHIFLSFFIAAHICLVLATYAIYQLRKREISLMQRESSRSGLEFSLDTRLETQDIIDYLKNNKPSEVVFWGTTLSSMIPGLQHDLPMYLNEGLKLQFILISRDVMEMAGLRSLPKNPTAESERISQTLEAAENTLKKLYSDKTNGELHYYCLNYLPPFTLIGFDLDKPNGCMYIRLSELQADHRIRPTLFLSKETNPKWFCQFRRQWNLARETSFVMDLVGEGPEQRWQLSNRHPN